MFKLPPTLKVRLCIFDTGARGVQIQSEVGPEVFVVVREGIVASDRPCEVSQNILDLRTAVAWAKRSGCQPTLTRELKN